MIGAESKRRIIRRHLNYNGIPHNKKLYELITAIVDEALKIDRLERKSKEKCIKQIRRVTL